MRKKLTAMLLVIVLICSLSIPAVANLNKDVRNSVVVVDCRLVSQLYGIQGLGQGTGFFVNDQYLITNHHLVEEFLASNAGDEYYVQISEGVTDMRYAEVLVYFDSGDHVTAAVVGFDTTRDLAVLKLDKPTTKRVPLELLVPTEEMVGTTIYAVGYPGIADNELARPTDQWSMEDATITGGTISRLLTSKGTGQENIQTDCVIQHGNSGGPVVTPDGHVVGVATWGVSNSGGESLGYVVNVSEVIRLLRDVGVDYTMANLTPNPTEPVNSGTDNTLLIAAIAVAALLIVAVVAIIVIPKKKPVASPAPQAPALKPVIRSFAQSNYGTSIVVGYQPVLVGRNNVCGLRFPDNAPGVSGSHCSIQWDPAIQVFVVTDLNSTYGTYMMSGQRIQPNQAYRLRVGEKIYLGEQGNVISLSLE